MPKREVTIEEMPNGINLAFSSLIRERMRLGLCPQCGECGKLDAAGGAICSTHGVYALQIVKTGADSTEDWIAEGENV